MPLLSLHPKASHKKWNAQCVTNVPHPKTFFGKDIVGQDIEIAAGFQEVFFHLVSEGFRIGCRFSGVEVGFRETGNLVLVGSK